MPLPDADDHEAAVRFALVVLGIILGILLSALAGGY